MGALRVNPMISKIELNYNKIGDTGGVSIAKALSVNAVLRVLHFGHNKVGDATAKTIADSLRANSTVLRGLYISTNNIGPEGGVAIGEMMRVNVQMQDLNIASNEIGDAGAVAIAEALAVNKVLVEFYCGGNRYSKDSKQKLKDAVEGRPAREGRPVDPYSPTSGGDGKVPFNAPHPDALPALSLIEKTVREHDL